MREAFPDLAVPPYPHPLTPDLLCSIFIYHLKLPDIIHRFPSWLSGKESTFYAEDAGDEGLIPGSGRSPGGGNGSPIQYPSLENPMDGGA